MLTNKVRNLAVLTAVIVIFGGCLAVDVEAATKVNTVKKKTAATKQVKPKSVKIATIKTEPVIEISEPVSKCLVKTIINLNTKAIKQMEADMAKYGKDKEAANQRYRYRLDMAWGAMQDPYCGYGGDYGLTDEIHSFKKSIERAKADYLKEVKKK